MNADLATVLRSARTGQRVRSGQAGPVYSQMVGVGPMGGPCVPNYSNGDCPPPGCLPPGVPLNVVLDRNIVGGSGGGRCREIALALSDDSIAGGASETLSVVAQATICPNRLVIFSNDTEGFAITAYTIGNVPQFLTTGNLHSKMFAPDAVQAIPMKGDCVAPGLTVSFTVTNLDGTNAQGIWIALIGPAQY